jgi:hypothetical protein
LVGCRPAPIAAVGSGPAVKHRHVVAGSPPSNACDESRLVTVAASNWKLDTSRTLTTIRLRGTTMMDVLAVAREATSVRATRPGSFNPLRRSDSRPLFVVTDLESLHRLIECLSIDHDSFAEMFALMTPGDLEFHFMRGHELLASITYIHPGLVRWSGWPYDALLQSSTGIVEWLTAHGGAHLVPTRRKEGSPV